MTFRVSIHLMSAELLVAVSCCRHVQENFLSKKSNPIVYNVLYKKGSNLMFQVVFRGGEGALQCLPPLIDALPEARLNLVIYYLKQGNTACTLLCGTETR